MSQEINSQITEEFRKSNRKLCNKLAKLPKEELLELLICELAMKQHQREADLKRVINAASASPNILRVLKNEPDDNT